MTNTLRAVVAAAALDTVRVAKEAVARAAAGHGHGVRVELRVGTSERGKIAQ